MVAGDNNVHGVEVVMAKQRIGIAHHGDIWVSTCGKMELRCGSWETALSDVPCVDATISDPPYGDRTHNGQRHGRRDPEYGADGWATARGLGYTNWIPADVHRFVESWSARTSGWLVCMTSHDLIPSHESAATDAGRYSFKPLPVVMKGMNVRLAGDGPSSWSVDLFVCRPRSMSKWGTLPGAYVGLPFDPGENTFTASRKANVVGSKPLWLMRAIVRDYTRPGDLVCDPCAGGGTTLLAAAMEGRRAIGAELDPETFVKAVRRLQGGYTRNLFV